MELYEWQKEAKQKWLSTNCKGIIKAVPGAGKTMAALSMIDNATTIVVVPTTSLKDQWTELTKHTSNISVVTIHYARTHQMTCELLIIDEIHRSTSPENINVYTNISYSKFIGLGATPNEINLEMFPLITDIGFDKANVCDFKVKFYTIELSPEERTEYNNLTRQISNVDRYSKDAEKIILLLALKRRTIVHNAKARLDKFDKIFERDKKTLIICRTIKQADMLSQKFNIGTCHSKSGDSAFLNFKNNITKSIVSVDMLKEGVDIPDLQNVIIYATVLSDIFHIQSIGRAIRKYEDKTAEIKIILAKDTSDDLVTPYAERFKYDVTYEIPPKPSQAQKDGFTKSLYYGGEKYSLTCRGIIKKEGKTKRRMPNMEHIEKIVRTNKPLGGVFVINQNDILIRDNDEYKIIGQTTPNGTL